MMKLELIDRIRKILDRTEENGCTRAEAESAVALASRLLAEHHLSLGDVAVEPQGLFGEETILETPRWAIDYSCAIEIVEKFFFVEHYILQCHTTGHGRRASTKRLVFFGTEANVTTARFVFHALLAACDRLWDEHRRRRGTPARERRIFVTGVCQGFRARLEQERRNLARDHDGPRTGGTALALQSVEQETRQAFEALHGDARTTNLVKTPLRGSTDTLHAGYQAGRCLTLSRSLDDDSTPAPTR